MVGFFMLRRWWVKRLESSMHECDVISISDGSRHENINNFVRVLSSSFI